MRIIRSLLLIGRAAAAAPLSAQTDTSVVAVPKDPGLTLEAYVEAYFNFDANEPAGATIPYFVSFDRHNEFNINLAYVSARYAAGRLRGVFTPGFGTYMNANYAAERVTLQNLVEANVGIQLSKGKGIWLDVGVLPSPYTNETAISLDQPTLTRSFAPEYVPYYLSGARLTLPLNGRSNLYAYLLNGWQQISDTNAPLAFGSWLEYKPTDQLSVNWNTYAGIERSPAAPANRYRWFQDLYAVYAPGTKWSFTGSVYYGWQEVEQPEGGYATHQWWQANASARYALKPDRSLYVRAETFHDPDQVMIVPITGAYGFDASSATLGYDVNITPAVKLRMESRYFLSSQEVYVRDGSPVKDDLWITGGITARFK